jgi:hypothetical protein
MQVLKHTRLEKKLIDTCERATFRDDPSSLGGNWSRDSLFAQTFAHDRLETEAIPFWGYPFEPLGYVFSTRFDRVEKRTGFIREATALHQD